VAGAMAWAWCEPAQAVACGQARVQLISPFVGRIHDWYRKAAGAAWDEMRSAAVDWATGLVTLAREPQPPMVASLVAEAKALAEAFEKPA